MTTSLLLALLILQLAPFAAPAAAPAPTEATPRESALASAGLAANLPDAPRIERRIAEVEASTALDEAGKAALIEQYRRALANLETIRGFETRAADYARALTEAPPETRAILERLEQARLKPEDPARGISDRLSSEELAQRLSLTLADAAIEETRIRELDKALDAGGARPTAARARIADINRQLDQVAADLAQPSVEGQSPELAEARAWTAETRRHALWSEARMLEQELLSQSVRDARNKAQREAAEQKLQALRALQRALEELQSQRRLAEAEAAQRASALAEEAAADKHALLQQLTRENARITESLTALTQQLDGFDEQLAGMAAERARVEEDFRGSQQRLEAAGLSQALGQVLFDRRNQLPDPRQYRRETAARENAIAETSLRQIRYREEQRELRDLNAYLDRLTAGDPTANTPEIRKQLAAALDQRKRLLTQALEVEDDYIRQLGELNYAADQLIRITERYDAFLAERLLWIRSALPIGLETLTALPAALAWFLSHERWVEIAAALAWQGTHSPLPWLGLLAIGLLFWRVPWMLRAIRATAEPLRRVRTDSLRHTARALAWTLLAALPLPLLIWLTGQQMAYAGAATAFTRALGTAMMSIAFGLYCLRAFRALCIPDGVADRHFRWPQEALTRIRLDFDWFTLYILPIMLSALMFYNYNDPSFSGSLGRLALVAGMIGFAVFFARLLYPSHSVLRHYLAEHPEGWINRTRHLWFPAIVLLPLVLAGLALAGYVYTAHILFQSLIYQTWLALALIVLMQTVVRWLNVARRRLALQAALDRQAARRDEAERGESGLTQVDEPEPDLAALDEQTRRLIHTALFLVALVGLWLTWSEILPALSLLERFALWSRGEVVDGVEQLVPVTAADLGTVLAIGVIATLIARNLPALLEILLLQSSEITAGGRYAIKTIASYVVVVIAFMTASSVLGLNWSQVQWLVAALSVGIGFGLQEIVANFISGLIILFERPVRVGDIVTIGDTTGVVTNIQIRATTIRNWDRQELIVPNKEFITGRLLNWSLTDQQNRFSIPVGVAYGSDTRKARALLAEIAAGHERILKDPAPVVTFESFGENSVVLVLRCFMDTLEGRIDVVTELHQRIYDSFGQHGIAIAFPQREVHLSTARPLDVRLRAEPRNWRRRG